MLIPALILPCTAAALLSIGAIWLITRNNDNLGDDDAGPISVLKPLCGADDSLESNLETFFNQRYSDYELVFGVEQRSDPAVAVARRLISRYPHIHARVVIHGRLGLNPKVANLRGILATGTHDLVVVSDSNIAVTPDYLSQLARRFTTALPGHPEPGLVTNLFAGAGARTLGSLFESVHLIGTIAGGGAASVGERLLCARLLAFMVKNEECAAVVVAATAVSAWVRATARSG